MTETPYARVVGDLLNTTRRLRELPDDAPEKVEEEDRLVYLTTQVRRLIELRVQVPFPAEFTQADLPALWPDGPADLSLVTARQDLFTGMAGLLLWSATFPCLPCGLPPTAYTSPLLPDFADLPALAGQAQPGLVPVPA